MSNIPTPAEARDILARFNASHFNRTDHEHARYRIPADPAHDDDIRLAAFIDHAERLGAMIEAAQEGSSIYAATTVQTAFIVRLPTTEKDNFTASCERAAQRKAQQADSMEKN